MSEVGLFFLGAAVTLIVVAALGLLIVGAALDGRYEAEQRKHPTEPVELLADERALHVVDAA